VNRSRRSLAACLKMDESEIVRGRRSHTGSWKARSAFRERVAGENNATVPLTGGNHCNAPRMHVSFDFSPNGGSLASPRWRPSEGEQHPLEVACAQLDDAVPLLTGDPMTTAKVLVEGSAERKELERLPDGQLLRQAARKAAAAVIVVGRAFLLQPEAIIYKPGELAVLFRALTHAFKPGRLRSPKPQTTRPATAEAPCHPRPPDDQPQSCSTRLDGFGVQAACCLPPLAASIASCRC